VERRPARAPAIRSRRDAEILRLRAEEQLTTEEVAEVMGMSPQHTRRRVASTVELIIDELGGFSDREEIDRATESVERILRRLRSA
jgi:DNA-directed RNA polymerase specialized sigma24 family protein